MKICPNCQKEFDDKCLLCDQCGGKLQETDGSAVKKSTHSFFDKCEEIEDQAICKKSGVKFYPDKGF
jgi:predicted amidophosphoribosyltransferase